MTLDEGITKCLVPLTGQVKISVHLSACALATAVTFVIASISRYQTKTYRVSSCSEFPLTRNNEQCHGEARSLLTGIPFPANPCCKITTA